jgi:hypothetical protein
MLTNPLQPKIRDRSRPEFHGSPARGDLSSVEGHGREAVFGNPGVTAQGQIEPGRNGLNMVSGIRDHDVVDDFWDLGRHGTQAARLHHARQVADDWPPHARAAWAMENCSRMTPSIVRLDVAVLVDQSHADQRHVDSRCRSPSHELGAASGAGVRDRDRHLRPSPGQAMRDREQRGAASTRLAGRSSLCGDRSRYPASRRAVGERESSP